jgi:hypothetical protein
VSPEREVVPNAGPGHGSARSRDRVHAMQRSLLVQKEGRGKAYVRTTGVPSWRVGVGMYDSRYMV